MRHLLTLMTMLGKDLNSILQMWVDWFFQHCIVVSLLVEYFILKNKEISARQQKKNGHSILRAANNENEIWNMDVLPLLNAVCTEISLTYLQFSQGFGGSQHTYSPL